MMIYKRWPFYKCYNRTFSYASEGVHVAEYILSRELDSFPFSCDQNTQNILCHYGKDEDLKPSEADIFMDFEITRWGIFGTTQLDTGLDQIGLIKYRC